MFKPLALIALILFFCLGCDSKSVQDNYTAYVKVETILSKKSPLLAYEKQQLRRLVTTNEFSEKQLVNLRELLHGHMNFEVAPENQRVVLKRIEKILAVSRKLSSH